MSVNTQSFLARATLWLTLSEIIYNVSGYIIHSAVGRILGPEAYGRFGIVITLTTMIVILIGNGVPTAMAKYISEVASSRPHIVAAIKRTAARVQMLLMLAVTAVFFLLAPLFADLLGDRTLTPLFQLSSLIIPAFAAASFYFSFFTGLHLFGVQAILKTARSVARLIIIISLAYLFGVEGAVAGYIAAPLLVFLVAVWIDRRWNILAPWREEARTHFAWKRLASFAVPVTLFMLFYELFISADLFLIKRLLASDLSAGLYNAALTIARIPYYLFYALTIVLLPAVSRALANGDGSGARRIVEQTLRAERIFLFPAVALIAAFAPSLIELFYGGSYAAATEALRILSLGAGFLTVFYVLSFAFSGAGKAHIPMKIAGAGLAVNVILGVAFIPSYGIMGAAAATTAASLALMLLSLRAARKEFGADPSIGKMLLTLLVAAILFFAALLFPQHPLWFLLWSIPLLGGYFLLLFSLGEVEKDDIRLFFFRKYNR